MVSIKEAAESAMNFGRATLGPERADLRLEEVESITTDGNEAWLITLSMTNPDPSDIDPALTSALNPTKHRQYKTFTVLKNNGEVIAMKIRQLAYA